MAREKMFDPAFQKAFTEAILKENKIRMKWNLEHGSLLKSATDSFYCDDKPDDDDDDFIPDSLPDHPQLEPQIETQLLQHDKYKISDDDPGVKEFEQPPPIMKPVPVDVKRLLYKGFSREGEGKRRYLTERYQKNPEDKFYFLITSSWEHGWTYGTHGKELKCSDYGRKQIIKASFFRRNDPQLKPRD